MACIPGLDGFKGALAVTHFADNDAVGAKAQGVFDEIGKFDGLGGFAGEEADLVPGGGVQFGRVFDNNGSCIDEGGKG